MQRVFAVATADGWCVEIKSNRLLNKPMIERLSLMLKSASPDAEAKAET
jgi:hypothetical protein